MKKLTVAFKGCEDFDDLDTHEKNLVGSGAVKVSSHIHEDEQEGHVDIEVEDWDEFFMKFKKTSSYWLSEF